MGDVFRFGEDMVVYFLQYKGFFAETVLNRKGAMNEAGTKLFQGIG